MAYNTNPKMPLVRARAIKMIDDGCSTRDVAAHLGYAQSTIVKWVKKSRELGYRAVPTRSSRPKTNKRALSREVLNAIIDQRQKNRRCGAVVHEELKRSGISVSLSSVHRTLSRAGLIKKRSPWKRPHDYTPRPEVQNAGDLVQIDTIHIIAPSGSRIYIYTLIDLYSRFAYAKVVSKIGAVETCSFLEEAFNTLPFDVSLIQTDHGPEFSTWFTHFCVRNNIVHRHSRVRKKNDNAHIERFNRSIQEECLDRIPNTIKRFEKEVPLYLSYYNTERLHMGINFKTPCEQLSDSKVLII